MFLYNTAVDKARSVKQGDMVSWNASGGRASGKVVRVVSSGTLSVPDSKFQLKGDKDNPAVLIQLYRDGKPTDKKVGHKLSSLTKSIDVIKHGSHDQKTHGRGRGGGGSGGSNKPNDSQKYIDAGYNEETCNEISSKLENADEEMEEALTDLEDELEASAKLKMEQIEQQGLRSQQQIKEQIKVVERAQKLSSDARLKVDDATRPIKTDKDFNEHVGGINDANGDIEDAINALGNGDNSVQALQSTLRDALGQIREYQDELDDTIGNP